MSRWSLPAGATQRPVSTGFDGFDNVNADAVDAPRMVNGRFFVSSGPFATSPGATSRGEAYTTMDILPNRHVTIHADFVAYLGPESALDTWHTIMQQQGPISSGQYAGTFPPSALLLSVRNGKLRWGGGAGPDYNWDNEKYIDIADFRSGARYHLVIDYITTSSPDPADQAMTIDVNGVRVFDGVAAGFSFPNGTMYADMDAAYFKFGLYKNGDILGRQWLCYSRLAIDQELPGVLSPAPAGTYSSLYEGTY